MITALLVVAIVSIGYLIGSIPTANIMMHLFAQKDLRQMGTGNVTSTAVMIHAGKLPGTLSHRGDTEDLALHCRSWSPGPRALGISSDSGGCFSRSGMERLAGVDRR